MNESPEQQSISWEQLQSELNAFSIKLEEALSELGILEKCQQLEMDHICVRLKQPDDVTRLKAELENIGEIISSVNVNGREISIIQLEQPLRVGEWQTSGIELPYPKPNHSYEDGWEHVEFVLTEGTEKMDNLRNEFFSTFSNLTQGQLEKLDYSEDEPHAEGDQLPNPTIGFKVNKIGLKFHANPIQKVVGYK